MTDAAWKNTERRIAELLDGKRIGPTGTPQPDVVSDFLVAEVKHGKGVVSKKDRRAIDQIRQHRDIQRMPIVVKHEVGTRYLDSVCLVILRDLLHYVKGAGGDEE